MHAYNRRTHHFVKSSYALQRNTFQLCSFHQKLTKTVRIFSGTSVYVWQ